MKSISFLYEKFLSSSGVCTDTRRISKNCFFIALKGPSFNGNSFATEAIEKGAKFAIVEEEKYSNGENIFLVKDGLLFLQKLAQYHRSQFNIPLIAITGSNGKTTTKELLAAVLETTYNTLFTQGNLNNHIGVPLTLLNIKSIHEIALIEMGANHVGEIRHLCQIAQPTHGIISNIGKAHLEGFGGIEGVKKAKGELYDYLAEYDGVVFLNRNEPFLAALAEKVQKKVFYTQSSNFAEKNDEYKAVQLESTPFVNLEFLDENATIVKIKSQLQGDYNFKNILTAVAIGKYFKVRTEDIKEGIESYKPSNNRSEIRKIGSNEIIFDAYNANPTSTLEALKHFAQTEANHKIVFLGDMLELGKYSTKEHQAIVDFCVNHLDAQVVLIGKNYEQTIAPKHFLKFTTTLQAKEWLANEKQKERLILLKGSRGVGLEKIFAE